MSSLMNAARRGEHGMAVVAVVVLIALLFLSGTAMALLVSSNLHTLDVVVHQDRVHYAAESAVARGATKAAASQSHECPLSTSECEKPLNKVASDPVRLLSVPSQWVASGDFPLRFSLPGDWKAVWTVVGWRASDPSTVVTVRIDGINGCETRASSLPASLVYVSCHQSDPSQANDQSRKDGPQQGVTSAVLHIVVSGGSIDLGSIVVRAASAGQSVIVTVVGQSGIEVDEGDLALPSRSINLWNTVLP
jgi:hypothetical protein